MSNAEKIQKTAINALKQLSQSEKWADYLSHLGKLYRYSFKNSLLIYEQSTKTNAFATFDQWNDLGRRINLGEHGTRILIEKNVTQKTQLVFDISQTNGDNVYVWKYDNRFEQYFVDLFSREYGFSNEIDFHKSLLNAASLNTEADISKFTDTLEKKDDKKFVGLFSNMVNFSVLHAVSIRCGFEGLDYTLFKTVSSFSINELVALGNAVTYLTRKSLTPIERKMKDEHTRTEREAKTVTKNNDGYDKTGVERHVYARNAGRRSGGSKRPDRQRDGADGREAHRNGLSDKSISQEGVGSDSTEYRQIRLDEVGTPEGVQTANVPSDGSRRDVDRILSGDQQERTRDDGDGKNQTGEIQERSGTIHEQMQGDRKQSDEGTGLQLKWHDRQTEDNSLPFFHSKHINQMLLSTPHLKAAKEEIVDFYADHLDKKDRTEYIKSIFNNDYTELLIGDEDQRVGYKTYQNVLHLWEGSYLKRTSQGYYDWGVIAGHFGGMILLNQFLDNSPGYPEQQQLSMIDKAEDKETSAFLIPQQAIDAILQQGSGVHDGKYRIYLQFEKSLSAKENVDFLKEEYGLGGSYPVLIGTDIREDHDSKGIKLYRGSEDIVLTWSSAQKRIGELIAADRYLTKKEKEHLPTYIQEAEERRNLYANKGNEVSENVVIVESKDQEVDQLPLFQNQDSTNVDEALKSDLTNFHIEDDNLGVGGAKEKFRNNIEAITLLKSIEAKERLATPDEQMVLSKYTGFGSLANAFDQHKADWHKEYSELKSLLTNSEYTNARASVLNAHYTSPIVIKAMYKALGNMGITSGNMLEPSCGVGNFLGLLPHSMSDVKMHGVELDSITGRISKQLYQNADIMIQGFETTSYQSGYFDFAIGNVPFGDFGVHDPEYNKHKFNIHDYFFAKTLEKVKSGGVIAFITSKGTLDKANNSVRKYIAQRAELIGAIRLPNTAFYKNAGTKVTSDIIFLRKRERVIDVEPSWVHLDKTTDGVTVNSYYTENPHMLLGRMVDDEGMYRANDTACVPFEGADLADQLDVAVSYLKSDLVKEEITEEKETVIEVEKVIPANPDVKRYSYTLENNLIYYRSNENMTLFEGSEKQADRIKGLVELRSLVYDVISSQVNDLPLEDIKESQRVLNAKYDAFVDAHGRIDSRPNSRVFRDDDSYFLLCSTEIYNEGKFVRKADIFDKLTIRSKREITHVDTAIEAYGVSLARKGKIDIGYMAQLTDESSQEVIDSLKGVIYKNPVTKVYESADEYLSGNVKSKLQQAKEAGKEFASHVVALEKVQPKPLEAMDIGVKLGTIWIPEQDYTDFMHETLSTWSYNKWDILVRYSPVTGEWNISNKSRESDSVTANQTYGTSRKSAYHILENALNQRPTKIYDRIEDADGKIKSVLNKRETMLASQKQVLLEQKFKDWIYKDQERRERLVNYYNDHFNNIRPREYDGSHIEFIGMSPEIELREHQRNAVARQLYGENTLLAHCVGAGKTFTMVAAAMEGKRLGLFNKSMVVVPNHLTKQTALEALRLYPAANILVTTKGDLSTNNRKKFCSRIATGDYDIVIIAHSQFERIPISLERQYMFLNREIDDIVSGIEQIRHEQGQKFNIKQMERTKKRLQNKLAKLNNAEKKDSVITFEELGVDRLFVDESHEYKNLFVATKMNNVAGVSSSESQKATDMYLKCQYINESNNNITFATGTPISNSMAEMYTNQRYLAMQELKERGLEHFDNWASVFGETKTAYEVNITAQGFKTTTRFSRFTNIPELMNMVREFMDIQTEDMLDLDTPKLKGGEVQTITTAPTDIQKEFIQSLNERYENLPNDADNALCITNDGRKVAIDQRLINPLLPDEDNSKVNALMQNVYDIWDRTRNTHDTQIVFCDVSTPKPNGAFSVYQDLKEKWIAKGIPSDEVAFIHDAKNDTQKENLFAKVRNGSVRILIGSTQKMGTGTNCQNKLIALHNLDVPWRPSDLEQRSGRILRQGNKHEEVEVFRYVTEGTFDTYNYQLLEQKQRYISQIMTSKSPTRSAEDLDDMTLSYAEVKALATGNPYIREKMELEVELQKLKLFKSEFKSNIYTLENKITNVFPRRIERYKEQIAAYKKDVEITSKFNEFSIELQGVVYTDKKKAGTQLIMMCSKTALSHDLIGTYKGLKLHLSLNRDFFRYELNLVGSATHKVELGQDQLGNLQRIENSVQSFSETLQKFEQQLNRTVDQLHVAEQEVKKPFEKEQELTDMLTRLEEINHKLDMDKPDEHDMVVQGEKTQDEKKNKQKKLRGRDESRKC